MRVERTYPLQDMRSLPLKGWGFWLFLGVGILSLVGGIAAHNLGLIALGIGATLLLPVLRFIMWTESWDAAYGQADLTEEHRHTVIKNDPSTQHLESGEHAKHNRHVLNKDWWICSCGKITRRDQQ